MPLSSYRQFDAALAFAAESVERTMERLLPRAFPGENSGEARVFEAMRYSSLGGGKRLRAFFVLAGATLFKVGAIPANRTASAIEFVHAYSLIHDDLPAMDDDDLRRGKPSCHKQFDEATAILAGDALQALAFEALADKDTHGDPAVRAALVVELAKAAGAQGMVGGQMLDLLAEQQVGEMSIGAITRLQRLNNRKAKDALGGKPRLLTSDEVVATTGHPVGGVCPFGLATPLPVYCDVSLRAFDEVVPAAGSINSALRIAPERLAKLVDAQWVDVCDRDIARFGIGFCPGCRRLRGAASVRCDTCGNAAPVTPDA